MKQFEIFIAYISWGSDGKSRPVLAFFIDKNKLWVFPITTQFEGKSEIIREKYFKINDWTQAGLERRSYIDTGLLINLPQSAINGKKPIGTLSTNDKQRLLTFLTKDEEPQKPVTPK